MPSPEAPAENLIRDSLNKILESTPFRVKHKRASQRSIQFLRFVVEEALAGRQDGIKEYHVGIKVFARADDFDPAVDRIVSLEAGRLRAKLNAYYKSEGISDSIRIEIPNGTYVPEFSWRPVPIGVGENKSSQTTAAIEAAYQLWPPWYIVLLLPSRTQWEKWSLPAKASYIGTIVGILSLILGLLSVPRWTRSEAPAETTRSESFQNHRIGISLSRLQTTSANTDRTKRIIEHPTVAADKTEILQWLPTTFHSTFDVVADDKIRITIDAETRSFVYVIDCEMYSDRGLGDGVLIFPTTRIENGNNEIAPGQAIDIPSATDNPPFLQVKKSSQTHIGEQLTVLLSPKPLADLNIGTQPMRISAKQIETFKSHSSTGVLIDKDTRHHDGPPTQTAATQMDYSVAGRNGGRLLYSIPVESTTSAAITLNLSFREIQ